MKGSRTTASGTAAAGLSFVLCPLLSFLLWAFPLLAQDGTSATGKLEGTGESQLGGEEVTLVKEETQSKQGAITAEDGSIALTQVLRGNCLLEIEAGGFEPCKTSTRAAAAKLAALSVKWKLRTVQEEVIDRPDTSDDRPSPQATRIQ